jgi:DNA helicase II / ATP-dependent DNA helicase PcrA
MRPYTPKDLHPTAEQRAIQMAAHPRVVVQANAGAAKTTTLALRVAQLWSQGGQPSDVLALTYTEPAVAALKAALKRVGVAREWRDKLRIHTFDDFARRQLAAAEGLAVPLYAQAERLKPLVLQAIANAQANSAERHLHEFGFEDDGAGSVEWLLNDFVQLKGTLLLALEAQGQLITPTMAAELGRDYAMLKVFRAFESLRAGFDRPVFRAPGDAVYDLALQLLSSEAPFAGDAVHPLELNVKLVVVDEMHDTHRAMFTVLKHLLAHNSAAAFVGVGDVDQVIHAVAGADSVFMGPLFDAELGAALRLPLTASYRFGATLAAAAGRLAHKTYASRTDRNTLVETLSFDSQHEAYRHITAAAQAKTTLSSKAPAAELAILLRQPHLSVALENQLLDSGVAYSAAGFDTYLMRPEVLFVRGLVACALGEFATIERPETRARVLQALLLFSGASIQTRSDNREEDARQTLKLAIEETAANPSAFNHFVQNQVLRHASAAARPLMEAAMALVSTHQHDPQVFLTHFVATLNPEKIAARVLVQAASVVQAAANIRGLVASAQGYHSVASFFAAMNEREMRHAAMRGKDGVVLTSIEAAKGLEFEHVLIPGLNAGEFALGGTSSDNRNLLYVAMTRAKNRLTLLYETPRPSRYLLDCGLLP